METCLYPGCGYRADFISKAHCRINHGMEREEIEKLYGKGKVTKIKFNDQIDKWIPSVEQILEAEKNGVNESALRRRANRGWEVDRALKTPIFTQEESGRMGAKFGKISYKRGKRHG